MRIDLVFPTLPPALDGIGDYTALLAAELGRRHRVRVLTAMAGAAAIPGVEVAAAMLPGLPAYRQGVPLLHAAVAADPPDWLVVQYNPFSYGRWGLNTYLPRALRRLRTRGPRLALMVHEPFVPVETWRSAVMTTWQRAQLLALGRTADLVLVAIEPWARRFRRWFPRTPVHHSPVGSNIPVVTEPAASEVRRRLGIGDHELVVGLFGSARPSRLLLFARTAVEHLTAAEHAVRVLYIGADGAAVRDALGPVALLDAGPLAAPAVSLHFRAMDLYLAPFRRGASERRGSLMAGLQHGIPIVSTHGSHTAPALRALDGRALCLAPDDDALRFARRTVDLAADAALRARIGEAGRTHFERTYTWPRIAADLDGVLAHVGDGASRSTEGIRL